MQVRLIFMVFVFNRLDDLQQLSVVCWLHSRLANYLIFSCSHLKNFFHQFFASLTSELLSGST